MNQHIIDFADRMRKQYLKSLGVEPALYPGTKHPVRAVPPAEVAVGGIFILGSHPTAAFERVGRRTLPIGNIARPFDPLTDSGKELDNAYLTPLGIHRSQCWITNLVKFFLFKAGHLTDEQAFTSAFPMRTNFATYARNEANLKWLSEELKLACPKLVITLGAEVAGALHPEVLMKDWGELLGGDQTTFTLRDFTYTAYHLAHPGIVTRADDPRNPWPEAHWNRHLPVVKRAVKQLEIVKVQKG
jgi:uracil-DNA glycosylase